LGIKASGYYIRHIAVIYGKLLSYIAAALA
jgi:hypothetical protein